MLAVGEQRVNIQNRNDDNPFAVLPMHDTERSVPDMDLPISEHTEFEVVERGIVCRSGLRLPEWCLHTGGESPLKPMVINLVDLSVLGSSSIIGRVLRGVRIGLTAVVVAVLLTLGISALSGVSGGLVVTVAVLVMGGVSVMLWFSRKNAKSRSVLPVCRLTGFVSRFRYRMSIIVGTLPAVLILVSSFTQLALQRLYLLMSCWVGLWLLQIILTRMFWSGTRLNCQRLPDGRFLVTGFAPGYWRRLEVQREKGQME